MSKKQILIMVGIFAATLVLLVTLVTVVVFVSAKPDNEQFEKNRTRLEEKMNQRQKVVYTAKDIAEGVVIKRTDLTIRLISAEKAPVDAVLNFKQAIGHKAKYAIQKGYIVSTSDLEP